MKFIAILLTLICFPTVALSHHARSAAYDESKVTEIEGEVIAVRWRNPHLRITVRRIDEGGNGEIWELEAGAVNIVVRFGLGRNDIQVGDRIKVAGAPGRQGRKTMFISNALLESGREVFLLPNAKPMWTNQRPTRTPISADIAAEADSKAKGIFRVWSNLRYPDTTVSLTEAAQKAKDAWDPLRDDLSLRCIPQGMPGMMQNPFPVEFTDNGDSIQLRLEEWDAVRTIYMKPVDPGQESSPYGISLGRLQGNTLIVTTTKVDWPFFDDLGTPQSQATEIVERFTLSEDENRLDYAATVSDPETFTEPAIMSGGYWQWVPGEKIEPYNCTLPDEK